MTILTPIRDEVLANAFRFSGIPSGLDALERHSRDMAMQNLERIVADAWWREVNADRLAREAERRNAEQARRLEIEMRRAETLNAVNGARARLRSLPDSRQSIILRAVAEGPKTRAEIQELLHISTAQCGKALRRMADAGQIRMTPIPGRRRQFAYEVAR